MWKVKVGAGIVDVVHMEGTVRMTEIIVFLAAESWAQKKTNYKREKHVGFVKRIYYQIDC